MSTFASLTLTTALLVVGLAAPAHALVNRAWVSGHGSDVAGCGSAGSPCRSLQYVHDNVIASGGEIDILDPAGYGAVTITKALSIINDGVGTAGVQQPTPSQDAIFINAGASDNVTLRGLNIDGLGVAGTGINFANGGSLTVINCVVRHFNTNGISVSPSAGDTLVSISNTIVSDILNTGISFSNSGGAVVGVISQTALVNNNTGVTVLGAGVSATIVDTVAFDNSNAGFQGPGPGATMRLARSLATGNGAGVVDNEGVSALTYSDNMIDGNKAYNVFGNALSPLANK